MTCLIFKCTIAENYIKKRNKEPFFEYNQVIKYCLMLSNFSQSPSVFTECDHPLPY